MVHQLCIAIALTLVACGDAGTDTDAFPDDHCDYQEQRDRTNDDILDLPGTAEPTELTFADRTALCGAFEPDHFDRQTIDIDAYTFALAEDADVLIRLVGGQIASLEAVAVGIYGGSALDQSIGDALYYGDHGVTAVHLPAGTYKVVTGAFDFQAPSVSVPYRIEITADKPATRCPALSDGGYQEKHDGATNTGNDVIAFPTLGSTLLTSAMNDAAEPTNFVIAPGEASRVTGSAAHVVTDADRYEDRDTFAIATDAETNELAVRLTWPGTADLDFYVFEVTDDSTPDPIASGSTAAAHLELQTFAVKPNARYWVTIGARGAAMALPESYAATLCGATFTR